MKKKITIIATDNIGREETISLIFEEKSRAFQRLKKASDDGYLRGELNLMEDESRYAGHGGSPYFSQSQLRRLFDFEHLIFCKFYNYKLSLKIK